MEKFIVKYRDNTGIVRVVSCKDEIGARNNMNAAINLKMTDYAWVEHEGNKICERRRSE